jgi:hypothetical protein
MGSVIFVHKEGSEQSVERLLMRVKRRGLPHMIFLNT